MPSSLFAGALGAVCICLTLTLAMPIAVYASGQMAGEPPAANMLSSLARGEWTVRFRDGTPPRTICVRDGSELIQLRHLERGCSKTLLHSAAQEVEFHYACRGNGYGQTRIRRETPRLVQLETNGYEAGRPFQVHAEGRRTGPCQ